MNDLYNYTEFKKMIDEMFKKHFKKIAITYLKDDGSKVFFSFSHIKNIISELCEVICSLGLSTGDIAAIVAPQSPYGIIVVLALAYLNITAIPIDASLPIEEINRLLEISEISFLFTTSEIKSKLNKNIINSVVCFNLNDKNKGIEIFDGSVLKAKRKNTYEQDDIIEILFSSGTSSVMKGVAITYTSMIEAHKKQKYVFGIKQGDKYLFVLPFHHMSGYSSMISFILTGCQIGIVENVNSTKLQKAFVEYNPNYFGMVPKVYDAIAVKVKQEISKKGRIIECLIMTLLNLSGFVRCNFGLNIGRILLKSIRSKVFGKEIIGLAVMGSTCKPETAKLFLNLGLNWANVYGSTECNAPICSTGIYDKYAFDSVGRVTQFNDIDIEIHDPNDCGIGEIYINTPMIMKEYFHDYDATKNAFDGKYFKTGDLGYIDKENYLHITGRVKESIILKNGEKVSAQDVDNFYQTVCPKVFIASCAVANGEGTDELHLFVETANKPKSIINQAITTLKGKSLENNSIYSLSGIHTIEKIPVTSIGKVKRYLLIENINIFNDYYKTDNVSKNYDANLIDETVKNIIAKHTKLDNEIMPKSMLSDDLGLDSLAIFETVCEIAEKTGVDVSNCLNNVQTVEELINVVENSENKNSEGILMDFPMPKTDKSIKLLRKWIKRCRKLYNFDVIGLENIPNENYILCSNHINNLDPIWLLAAMEKVDYKKTACLAAMHLFENKRTRAIFDTIGAIPVNRNGNTAPAVNRCRECLNEGYNLIIFPEGARTRDGNLLPFKNGAAMLAAETGKSIVPTRIDGAFEIFPRYKRLPSVFNWKKMKRHNLHISFGLPIDPHGKTVDEITNLIRKSIMEMEVNK